MEGVSYREGDIDPWDFERLRLAVGWEGHPMDANRIALERSLYLVSAWIDGRMVAMGRVIGDLGINFYVQDLVVLPAFQGRGLGRGIMERIMVYIRAAGTAGCFVGLMSARGMEGFYSKLGFRERPDSASGSGMYLEL
jgi:GNAT superfamily N-acetyltransferase